MRERLYDMSWTWRMVFACLLHHSLCGCHMCWIEFFTLPGKSTRTCIPVPPSNLPRQRKVVLSEFSHAGCQGTRSALPNKYNLQLLSLASNWVKTFFIFRYGEPSWRSKQRARHFALSRKHHHPDSARDECTRVTISDLICWTDQWQAYGSS